MVGKQQQHTREIMENPIQWSAENLEKYKKLYVPLQKKLPLPSPPPKNIPLHLQKIKPFEASEPEKKQSPEILKGKTGKPSSSKCILHWFQGFQPFSFTMHYGQCQIVGHRLVARPPLPQLALQGEFSFWRKKSLDASTLW